MATPNMGLILPTDHGSADTWDTILDAVFNRIDIHDHSPGLGVQIALSHLLFDADISAADAGGGKHAIFDLKAIDFAVVPPSAVAGFAGAFFVADGTGGTVANELYYRTVGGANVQFTNGGTMNSAFFVGGITGDYSAVGAQESYDDATNAFVFQQQVGAAVRQYAKLRASDLRLYEFKVHGTAGVPNFSVGLKSPAALANNYDLTMPGALPAAPSGLQVDATGAITTALNRRSEIGAASTAETPATQIVAGATRTFTTSNGPASISCPMPMPIGGTLTSWTAYLRKTSAAGTITCAMFDINMATGNAVQVGVSQTNNANNPGFITLGQAGLTANLAAGHAFYIAISPGGTTGDSLQGWEWIY